ncbi:MAG: GntR family transcriptional regulator [Anaerolineales bacterium]
MPMKQSKGDTRPLYQQTADAIGEILSKASPGTFLPSEPALADQLGVSRSTLREAMRLFEARGLIVRRRGIGTYVVRPPIVIESGLEELSSVETLAAQVGVEVEACDLEIEERPATECDASHLRIAVGTPIVELRRVILADGRPVAYFVDCLPRTHLDPTEVDEHFSGSVLRMLLDRHDLKLDRSQAEITALPADALVASGLSIHPGDVLLYLEACLLAEDGHVVDFSRSYCLPGTFRFHVVRRVQH